MGRGKDLDIIHGETYDGIINRRYPDQDKVGRLWEEVQNGIPDSWQQVFPESTNSLFVNSTEDPEFIGKTRNNATPVQYRVDKAKLTEAEARIGYAPESRKSISAHNSIVNEFSLTPDIKDVLASDEVTALVQDQGFRDIGYVEPLVGLIRRDYGKKQHFIHGKKDFIVLSMIGMIHII